MKLAKTPPARRIPRRLVVPAVLLAALFLPFIFIRAAFLALDARASSISCFGWRIAPRLLLDSPQDFDKELRRVYLENGGQELDPQSVDVAPDSVEDLISEMSSPSFYQHLDLRSFLLKTKAMLLKMDQKVQSSRLQVIFFQHLASIGLPKSINCLTLRLAEQYLTNSVARSSLPPPEHASRLTDNSYHHIVLITDNVVAASVVVSSSISSCSDPEKLVFHIVTDRKTCNSMHAWFALHSFLPAVVEVRGLHQFDFPPDANAVIMSTVEELRRSLSAYRHYRGADKEYRRLLDLRPNMFSLLNYIRMHLPELFPKLEKVIYLDDDVVVQRDLTPLWHLELQGLVMGAVSLQDSDEVLKTFGDYLNFSNSMLSSPELELRRDRCAWSEGLNILDLRAWRKKKNITRVYQHWLKLNRESGFELWPMGPLPPALIAFDKQHLPLERSWLSTGLGWQMPDDPDRLKSPAVLHFSGPGKPWLETGHAELQRIWRSYLNHSDELISSCMVMEG